MIILLWWGQSELSAAFILSDFYLLGSPALVLNPTPADGCCVFDLKSDWLCGTNHRLFLYFFIKQVPVKLSQLLAAELTVANFLTDRKCYSDEKETLYELILKFLKVAHCHV